MYVTSSSLHTRTRTEAHTHHSLGPQGGLDQITNGNGSHKGGLEGKYTFTVLLSLDAHKKVVLTKLPCYLKRNKNIQTTFVISILMTTRKNDLNRISTWYGS